MDPLSAQLIFDEPNNPIENENSSLIALTADRISLILPTVLPTNLITSGSITNTAITNGGGVGGFNETTSSMPKVQGIIVSILLLIVIFGTVIGNILVCFAVCFVRKIRLAFN